MKMKYLLIIMFNILVLNSCAVFDRNNTPVLNAFEKYAVPENNTARALLYPLLIPAGLIAVSTDAIIIHPVTVIDDAYHDTVDMLWDNFDWKNEYVTECASLVPRTALSPIVFTCGFLGRSAFKFPEKEYRRSSIQKNKIIIKGDHKEQKEREKIQKDAKQNMKRAEESLINKNYVAALAEVNLALKKNPRIRNGKETKTKILIKLGQYKDLHRMFKYDPVLLCNNEIVELLIHHLHHNPDEQKMVILHVLESSFKNVPIGLKCNKLTKVYIKDGIEPLLKSNDRAIIYQAMLVISHVNTYEAGEVLRKIIINGDPVLSITAKKLLEEN